jgi:hypothetical protein
VFNNKIDKFDEYDNKISNLSQEELELSKKLADIRENKEKLQLERRDYGIQYYLDKVKRQTIIELAEQFGYSPDKLEELRPYIENWNQDIVDNDRLDSLRMVEKFVNDNQEPYTKNILYKLAQLFSDKGGNSNEN